MNAPRRPDEENASPAFLQKQDRFGDHLDQFRRPQKVKLSLSSAMTSTTLCYP